MTTIRDATPADADAACEVMRRSIAELCEADHHNDPKILAAWLANKQPRIFEAWLAEPDNSVLIAIEDATIVSVGAVRNSGEITLNYVLPDARFRGVSRALLAALEQRAIERGNHRCFLASTATARRFYLANGYVETGRPAAQFGTSSGFPMSKALK
jgi:GNAT superfamily N-acetyltransferase